MDIFNFPLIFRPFEPSDGWDYSKILADDESYHEGHGQAYKKYGIDPKKGCAVILRPDQYVSWVGEMDDYDMMDKFFSGFMREQKGGPNKVDIDAPEGALEYKLKNDTALANGDGKAAMDGAVKGDAAL